MQRTERVKIAESVWRNLNPGARTQRAHLKGAHTSDLSKQGLSGRYQAPTVSPVCKSRRGPTRSSDIRAVSSPGRYQGGKSTRYLSSTLFLIRRVSHVLLCSRVQLWFRVHTICFPPVANQQTVRTSKASVKSTCERQCLDRTARLRPK